MDVEGAATKGAGSSSPEPGDAATLSLKRQNENATRELSYGIKGKGKHTSLDGPSDVDVDVEDGSGLLEEMVRLLQYSLEVVAVVLLGCWLQDTIFLTLSPQCKCEEEASPGETSPSGTLSTSILLEPEAAPMSTTLAKELNISTRSILVFLEASESFLKRLLFKARASRRPACSSFLLMLSIFTAAQFSYVLLLPRSLSD